MPLRTIGFITGTSIERSAPHCYAAVRLPDDDLRWWIGGSVASKKRESKSDRKRTKLEKRRRKLEKKLRKVEALLKALKPSKIPTASARKAKRSVKIAAASRATKQATRPAPKVKRASKTTARKATKSKSSANSEAKSARGPTRARRVPSAMVVASTPRPTTPDAHETVPGAVLPPSNMAPDQT